MCAGAEPSGAAGMATTAAPDSGGASQSNYTMLPSSGPNSMAGLSTRPGFQLGLDQGTQGLQRSLTSQGYLGSGNAQMQLSNYVQDYALRFLNQEQQRLAQLAGAGSATRPMSGAMNPANNLRR